MAIPPAFSTAIVPPQFLETAMLTSSTPLKALHSDPRISYSLYIPTNHYNPDPSRALHSSTRAAEASHPSYKLPKLPLIISIHGSGRDATSCQRRLARFADEERCAVLAPLYPAGLDDELDLDSYKVLRSKSLKADLALLDIIAEVQGRYPGFETERFFLIGFSGGAQFVQRFLYVHPQRVIAASVGAPGRVTRLDGSLEWPRGVKAIGEVFEKELGGRGGEVRLDLLRRIRAVQMVVGEKDVEVPDEEFIEWVEKMSVRRSSGEDGKRMLGLEPMRATRVETLRKLHQEWSDLGIETRFEIVNGVGHDSKGIHPAVEAFLRPQLREWWESREGA
jgi:pimeloyl-ACP methyl ester carboxylesterase